MKGSKKQLVKNISLQVFLYHILFVFMVSTSVYGSVQQTNVLTPSQIEDRSAEEKGVTDKQDMAEFPSDATGKEGGDQEPQNTLEAGTPDDDQETAMIAASIGMGLSVLLGVLASSGGSYDKSGNAVSTSSVDTDLSVVGSSAGSETINFQSPIRIGDDKDYNGNHDDDFQINTPSGITYSESFTISSSFSKGTLKYTIAGAMESAKIYMNGVLVGRSCTPGNTAYARKECDPIDVSSQLKVGSNVVKIACVLYPNDTVKPYDDIEIYNLRLILE